MIIYAIVYSFSTFISFHHFNEQNNLYQFMLNKTGFYVKFSSFKFRFLCLIRFKAIFMMKITIFSQLRNLILYFRSNKIRDKFLNIQKYLVLIVPHFV